MPFKPGISGNPSGKPIKSKKTLLVEMMARKHTEEALEVLVEVMQDKTAKGSERVSAAVAVLDRGWGKPKQDVNLTTDDDLSAASDADVDAAFKAELADFIVSRGPRGSETSH